MNETAVEFIIIASGAPLARSRYRRRLVGALIVTGRSHLVGRHRSKDSDQGGIMQRSISRRDFGKGLAGGAAFLALQPAWNRLAIAQSLRNDLKDLGGEWAFDDAALQATADDF